MTTLKSVHVVVCAGALAIGAGCSKSEPEETAPPQPSTTQGSEPETTTQAETHRMDESSRGSSAAKATDEKPATGDQMTAMPGQAAAQQLSDSEIARITDVVNTGEVEQALVAKDKAGNPQVKQFAQRMITDHRKAKKEGDKLVKQTGIIPQESAKATEMADEGTRVLESLRTTAPGEGFDALYMQSQVKQHQDALDALDQQLIPSAQNPKLKAELKETRRMIEHHLIEARGIEQSLPD